VASRLTLVEGRAPAALQGLSQPNAIFVGGGGNPSLFDALWARMPPGTRLVANAVTLETETLLLDEQSRRGGDLLRIELAHAAPLGGMRGWAPARPVVQWSVRR